MPDQEIEARVGVIVSLSERLQARAAGAVSAGNGRMSRSEFLEKRADEFAAAGDFKQAQNYRATAALVRRSRPAARDCRGEED